MVKDYRLLIHSKDHHLPDNQTPKTKPVGSNPITKETDVSPLAEDAGLARRVIGDLNVSPGLCLSSRGSAGCGFLSVRVHHPLASSPRPPVKAAKGKQLGSPA